MRDLFNNTLLAALAFFINGLLGILIVPVIVQTWGLAAYGLIILARFFIPQGFLATADLGASEITTQAVARACVNHDWATASQWIGFIAAMASVVGVVVGLVIYALIPVWVRLFNVDPADAAAFGQVIAATGAACILLFPALVAEGVVKGFEQFAVLRAVEVGSTLAYVLGALLAAQIGAPFATVALLYLAALVGRFLILSALALHLGRKHGLVLRLPKESSLRREMAHYIWIMTQTKAVGALQNQSMPPLVGALFGPSATALFDLLIRLPRFAKQALSALNTSLLPVFARIEERGALDGMRRLGRVGLVVLPAVTIPPLVGAAVLSEPILKFWIGPDIAMLWPWMAIMFAVPIAAQYLGFGGAVMLARPKVQALLNRIAMAQIAVMAVIAFVLMGTLEERAFILAQASSVMLILPFQLWILARELGIRRRVVARTVGFQFLALGFAVAPALFALQSYELENPIELGISLAVWCAFMWSFEYALLLTPDNRIELGRMARAVMQLGRRTVG